jgi:hypothetical protein
MADRITEIVERMFTQQTCGQKKGHECPNGHSCTLDAFVNHALHICSNPD